MFRRKKKEKIKQQSHDVFGIHSTYSAEVQNYLAVNRDAFIEGWAEICEKTNGRVSYDDLYELLGRDFPKAPWNYPEDRDANIRDFFKELGIPCKADTTHIYFP